MGDLYLATNSGYAPGDIILRPAALSSEDSAAAPGSGGWHVAGRVTARISRRAVRRRRLTISVSAACGAPSTCTLRLACSAIVAVAGPARYHAHVTTAPRVRSRGRSETRYVITASAVAADRYRLESTSRHPLLTRAELPNWQTAILAADDEQVLLLLASQI